MRYEFRGEFKTDIFVKVSEIDTIKNPAKTEVKKLTDKLARNLTATLDELKKDVAAQKTGDSYVNLLR